MLKLAEVMPPSRRAMNRIGSVSASAMIRKSIARPAFEIRMTGRRPKRSDSAPCTGEAKNCISMKPVANSPCQTVPVAISPPVTCLSSAGSTGMTTPKASTSTSTVMKMKASAARRPGGATTGAGASKRKGPGGRRAV